MKRWLIYVGGCEELPIGGVESCRRVIGSDIPSIGGDCYRRGEINLLPTGRTLSAEGCSGQHGSGTGPESAGMGTGILAALVEADARDVAAHVRGELDAQFNGTSVVKRRRGRGCIAAPNRAGARCRRADCR